MGVSVRVVAPYVTLRVKTMTGSEMVGGYYAGAVLEAVEGEVLERHLSRGMVEAMPATVESVAEPEASVPERPAGNASQEAWAKYALDSNQASEDEVKDLTRDELRELYG